MISKINSALSSPTIVKFLITLVCGKSEISKLNYFKILVIFFNNYFILSDLFRLKNH